MKSLTAISCKFLAASAFGALAFTACGDDVTKTTVNETTGIEQLAAGEEFPECTAESAGDMFFAADSGKVYYCADGEWSTLNGEDGKDGAAGASCTAEPLADSSGYTVICDGDTVGTLKNGADGTDGKAGENGKDGVDGTNGKDGADGTSCELSDNGDGTVEVTCGKNSATLYKALCGTSAYDPETQTCEDGTLYNLCGANKYNPKTQICDARDNQVYNIVTIGEQVWMAQNLNYTTAENSYCYVNESSNCETYGRLYTWAAATDACPEGFHLPTYDEFNTLIEKVGGSSSAGTALKATDGWNDSGNGEDTYGFSALPAGYRYDGYFYYAGNYASFWSATGSSEGRARGLRLDYSGESASLSRYDKSDAFSVRCLKD